MTFVFCLMSLKAVLIFHFLDAEDVDAEDSDGQYDLL